MSVAVHPHGPHHTDTSPTLDPLAERRNLDTAVRASLTEAAQVGGADLVEAQHEVVTRYLWLADGIARKYSHRGEDPDDLQQIARTALLEATQRYDPSRGPFAAFAVPTITGVLKRHFRDFGWLVRPPRRTQQLSVEISRQWPEIVQDQQQAPDDEQLATALGESVADIREARQASHGYRGVSLDAPTRYHDTPAPGTDLERCEASLLAGQVWQLLSAEERRLFRLRFWEGRSQSDIAARIGTNQMQVSRALDRTLTRVRRLLEIERVA